jgi:para-aminobenzoate synthetase / 4-amino-4-deoxychorismate lyase
MFALFGPPEQTLPRHGSVRPYTVGEWEPLVSAEAYREAVSAIRQKIGDGETYQVNYTFPMRAAFSGDALSWFRALCAAQRADFCAYIDTGRFKLLSLSPELFFHLDGEALTVRPMKGTRPRGLWPAADEEAAQALADSEKDRAENVMIVDLMRNDLGRIAEPGSVEVTSLHDVERYETVWQMTSTVTCRSQAALPRLFEALFPRDR